MMPLKHWRTIAVVGLFLAALAFMGEWIIYVPGYADLRQSHPIYIAQSYRSFIGVVLVLLLAHALLRRTETGVLDALGLTQSPWRPMLAAVIAVIPLYVVFTISFGFFEMVPLEVLLLAVLSPFSEELAYRGFAFGFLRRVAGWGFWPAALAPAAFFGIVQIVQASDPTLLLINLMLTGGGALFFAWLFEKWGGLWMPFALHALMNLAWQLFAVGESPSAQNLSIWMQLAAVGIAVLVTIFRARLRLPEPFQLGALLRRDSGQKKSLG